MSLTAVSLALLGILASLVAYILIAWPARSDLAPRGKQSSITSFSEYLMAFKRMDSNEFANAQIAYSLQLSTIVPFFFFVSNRESYLGLLNTVFWGIGIIIFQYSMKKVLKNSNFSQPGDGRLESLHGFIARAHKYPSLRLYASVVSIFGFAGLFLSEIVFAAAVVNILFQGDKILEYSVVLLLGLYTIIYVLSGGQEGAIRTDQLQLVLGYLGLHGVLGYLLFSARLESVPADIFAAMIALACFAAWIALSRLQKIRSYLKTNGKGYARFYVFLNAILVLSFLVLLVAIIHWIGTTTQRVTVTSYFWAELTAKFAQHNADVLAAILTVCLLPIFWQFIDVSNWQRMASVKSEKSGIVEGLFDFFRESPATWLMPILLAIVAMGGWIAFKEGEDLFGTFLLKTLSTGGWAGDLAGSLLAVGLIAIAFSTADAALTAVAYCYTFDCSKKSGEIIQKGAVSTDDDLHVKRVAKGSVAIVGGACLLLYVFFDMIGINGSNFTTFLFAFFGAINLLAPSVLMPLWTRRRRAPGRWIRISYAVGLAWILMCMFASIVVDTKWQWYSLPIAAVFVWTVYVVGAIKNGPQRV